MFRSTVFSICLVLAWTLCFALISDAADTRPKTISLPKPDTLGGKPLMQALSLRKSDRTFSTRSLSDQDLSNLLWACWGVNRSDGRRTVPTAQNSQRVAVYVALETGVWLYDGAKNELTLALEDDTRRKFGNWPTTLLFAAPGDDRAAGMHVGSLYQNAGLYCASAGLSNVVKLTGSDALDGILKLPQGYKVFVVHSIGYPQ